MKIAVTGYKGRLGSELVEMGGIPLECDITSGQSILNAIEKVKPAAIINCAAITSVDFCETEEGNEQALKVNFRGAMNIRTNFRGHLIHLSTDYVFDCKDGAYSEDYDELHPARPERVDHWRQDAGFDLAAGEHPHRIQAIGTGVRHGYLRKRFTYCHSGRF